MKKLLAILVVLGAIGCGGDSGYDPCNPPQWQCQCTRTGSGPLETHRYCMRGDPDPWWTYEEGQVAYELGEQVDSYCFDATCVLLAEPCHLCR